MTKPIIIVKMPCKLLYVCHSSKRILNKMFNFLALLDIRVFDRLYLWLLIGLALFLQPGCFCLALNLLGYLNIIKLFQSRHMPGFLTLLCPGSRYVCMHVYVHPRL